MSTQKFYDNIAAKNYNSNPFYKIIYEASFIDLLAKALKIYQGGSQYPKVLDIGCGEAGFLKLFNQQIKDSVLCGIDISSSMMDKGLAEIDFLSIYMDAPKGLKMLIKLGIKFDFIVISFVSAYLDLVQIAPLVKELLAPKGLILYQGSLKTSLPAITHNLYTQYEYSKNPLRRSVAKKFHEELNKTYLFSTVDEISSVFLKEGLVELESYVKKIDLNFSSLRQWIKFIRDGGWGAPHMSGYRYFIAYLALCLKIYSYPKHDQSVIGCVIVGHA